MSDRPKIRIFLKNKFKYDGYELEEESNDLYLVFMDGVTNTKMKLPHTSIDRVQYLEVGKWGLLEKQQ